MTALLAPGWPVGVYFKPKGAVLQTGERTNYRLPIGVWGTDDYATAIGIVNDSTYGTYWGGYPLIDVEITQQLPYLWTGHVAYGTPSFANVSAGADVLYQFETSGQNTRKTHSYATVQQYNNPNTPPGGGSLITAPSNSHAIGVDASGEPQGCDVVIPVYNWSQTHYFGPQLPTPSFRSNLYFATGKVNNAAWGGYNAGEVLFLGCTGQRRGGANGPDWEITYRFAASPNCDTTNNLLTIPPFGVITKGGWNYVWVQYQNFTDPADSNKQRQIAFPIGLYVEQVYNSSDFTTLGISSDAYDPSGFGLSVPTVDS